MIEEVFLVSERLQHIYNEKEVHGETVNIYETARDN